MDSDDDIETGLPKVQVSTNDFPVGSLNVNDLIAGKPQEFVFDAPTIVKTERYKGRNAPPPHVAQGATYEQMKLPFLTGEEHKKILEVMFGDYSEIEPFMQNITENGMVKKRMLRPGTGKKVIPQNMVAIHYMMGAEEMDDLIESTYCYEEDKKEKKRRGPGLRRFRVGAGEVLPVLDIGVATMRVGEIAKFLATSEYGFGKLGVPLQDTMIPSGARLMVQIEVVETYERGGSIGIAQMSPTERSELPFEKLFTHGEKMKMDGNWKFKEGHLERATNCYLEALEAVKDMQPMSSEEKSKYLVLRHQVCNNIAHVYFKMGKFNRALKYAEEGIEAPGGVLLKAKSHYWCAKAMFELRRYELCLDHVKKAEEKRGDDGDVKALRKRVEMKMKEVDEKEKELFARMMATKM